MTKPALYLPTLLRRFLVYHRAIPNKLNIKKPAIKAAGTMVPVLIPLPLLKFLPPESTVEFWLDDLLGSMDGSKGGGVLRPGGEGTDGTFGVPPSEELLGGGESVEGESGDAFLGGGADGWLLGGGGVDGVDGGV